MSVLIATFNAEAFIETTLTSVRRQTLADIEIVVVDDGSSDRTADVIRRVMASDGRVRLFEQANHGLSRSRNRGVVEARGDLIAFLDHDDIWHPDKLRLQVALLDARRDVAVASCFSAVVDERQHCLGWRYGGRADGQVYSEMLQWDIISGGSVAVIRKTALDAVGSFDESLHVREDWDMWIRLARRFRFGTVPRTLVGYTRRAGSASRDYDRMAEEGAAVLRKAALDDPEFSGSSYRFCRARDYFAVASLCTIDQRPAQAWRFLARSVTWSPTPLLRSPRRWGLVGALALQTILPQRLFRSVLSAANRVSFQLPPGLPFAEIPEPPS